MISNGLVARQHIVRALLTAIVRFPVASLLDEPLRLTASRFEWQRGASVAILQAQLAMLGLLTPNREIDCIFGPKTDRAVKQFQSLYGREPNGIVDQATQTEIDLALGKATPFFHSVKTTLRQISLMTA